MNKLRKHGVYYDSRIKLLLILLTSALAFALGGGLTGFRKNQSSFWMNQQAG